MKNPVNRLATAAPRALESILAPKDDGNKKKNKQEELRRERTRSFDIDLSGLNLDSSPSLSGGSSIAGLTSAGSIAEETGSVVTFEELSSGDLSLDWNDGTPSPN